MGNAGVKVCDDEFSVEWDDEIASLNGDKPIKVAVIGAGVAGLGAAWHLSKKAGVDLTVFEACNVAGGHANTMDVEVEDGKVVPVDTGFMVYNHQNYPNMVGLFRELGVEDEDTDMSFSVSLDDGRVEWCSAGFSSLFASRRNALRPAFYGMLRDMVRFNREAPLLLLLDDDDPRKAATVGEYLREHGYGDSFCEWYLQPMAAALWSSSDRDIRDFSAALMVSFFHNHNMLQVVGRPQWKTPAGRSRKYVDAVCRQLGPRLLLGTPVRRVRRASDEGSSESSAAGGAGDGGDGSAEYGSGGGGGGAEAGGGGEREGGVGGGESIVESCTAADAKWAVVDASGVEHIFDKVIFACHTDQALDVLGAEASAEEREALGSFIFAENAVYLHSDDRLMPVRHRAWASWNYISAAPQPPAPAGTGPAAVAAARGSAGADSTAATAASKPVFVTYWLNRLQNLDTTTEIFISLNPTVPPDPAKVHRKMTYAHPQLTPAGMRAQQSVAALNGRRGLWFCGAWAGYGFHEDGLRSGLEAACAITGQPVPWAQSSAPPSPTASKPLAAAAAAAASPPPPPPLRSAIGGGSSPPKRQRPLRAMVLPPPSVPPTAGILRAARRTVVGAVQALAFYSIKHFLSRSIRKGCLVLRLPDGRRRAFGDALCTDPDQIVAIRVYDWNFFVRVALEYDLGLARGYMAGEWAVDGDTKYADGLRRLFLLFVLNRDAPSSGFKAGRLLLSWVGYTLNFVRYKLSLDNSLSGSRSNIHAHYDLSNDLFCTFLDKELMMYSSAIYDAEVDAVRPGHLAFKDTLESAQLRKVDTLLARARVGPGHRLLDIGFGWGGISIRAAERFGCRVHGITLSIEQKKLAESRVRERGLENLITFELVDYRVFAKHHPGEFDRIISCEMIEAVGHNYLGTFFAAVERLLKPDGVFVMEAITTPESRYAEYLRSTDFINTIIFPGSCCPSLAALVNAMATDSKLSLESYDNICMHYAETLRDWRYRFNDNEAAVRAQGFDATFIRCWNYYFTYCEAGFHSQTEGCLILTFSRPGNASLLPASETRAIVGPR